jgi:hypothetical protein
MSSKQNPVLTAKDAKKRQGFTNKDHSFVFFFEFNLAVQLSAFLYERL